MSVIGRTTNALRQNIALQDIARSNRSLLKTQEQLSTNRKFNRPSDDPVGSNLVMRMENEIVKNEQYTRNQSQTKNFLSISESSLSEFNNFINTARTIMLREMQDTATSDSRRIAAVEVNSILSQALGTANRDFGGRFLFGGTMTDAKPFEEFDNFIKFAGNLDIFSTDLDQSNSVDMNITGAKAFGALNTQVRGDVNLDPNVTYGGMTSIIENPVGGAGYTITDSALVGKGGNAFVGLDVRIRTSPTTEESRRIVAYDGTTGTITLDPAGAALSPAVVVGQNYQITGVATNLADLNNGRGASVGYFRVNDGTNYVDVDIRQARDIADVIDAINAAGLNVSAGLNAAGNGLELTPTLGNSITVSELSGNTVATELGIVGTSAVPGASIVGTDLDPLLRQNTAVGLLRGGTGFDQTSGMTVTNGNDMQTINFANAFIVEDIFNTVRATNINAYVKQQDNTTNQIDFISSLNGARFFVDENGGTTASDLGLFMDLDEIGIDQLNNGKGIQTVEGADAEAVLSDGSRFSVNLSGANNLQAVADVLNLAGNGDITATVSRSDVSVLFGNSNTSLDFGFVNTDTTGLFTNIFQSAQTVGVLAPPVIVADNFTFNFAFGPLNPTIQINNSGVTTETEIYSLIGDSIAGSAQWSDLGGGNYSIVGANGLQMDLALPVPMTPGDLLNNIVGSIATLDPAVTLTPLNAGQDFQLDFAGDSSSTIFDVTGATDFADLMGKIDTAIASPTGETTVSATNAFYLQVVDNTGGGGNFEFNPLNGSFAIDNLGLRQSIPTGETMLGRDLAVVGTRSDSIFTALVELRVALESGDRDEIASIESVLNMAEALVLAARTEVGSRIQQVDAIGNRLEDNNLSLESIVSGQRDIDMAEVIMNFQMQQNTLQAGLAATGQILNLSLLDFI